MKKRILFVDDEPNVLQGLRRMLHPLRQEWDMTFVQSGEDALKKLGESSFDVIVSDVYMQGMDGVQLLSEVTRRYPQMIRIFLSGQCDLETILKSVTPAHQFLSKPCDANMLKNTIIRASVLRDLLSSDALKKLVTGMTSLPSLPSLFFELLEELKSPRARTERIANIIGRDVAMTAKILQLVNSAFFGLTQRMTDLNRAVAYLGFDTIQSLALSIRIFSQFNQEMLKSLSLEALWSHSLSTASWARAIARVEAHTQKAADDAFVAGLLHDIGRLVLAANLPDLYRQVVAMTQEKELHLWEAEYQILKVTHTEVGAYLLGLWGLPDSIVETAAFHHNPDKCLGTTFGSVTAVHVAEFLGKGESGADSHPKRAEVDVAYLTRLGLVERLPIWEAECKRCLHGGNSR